MLALASLALAAWAAPDLDLTEPPGVALLLVERGLVAVRTGTELEQRGSWDQPLELAPEISLEVGPGGSCRIRFPSRGSIRVLGPARLKLDRRDASRPRLRVDRLRTLDCEMRRGTLLASLPGDWKLELTGGALGLAAGRGQEVLLSHHGGACVELVHKGIEGFEKPVAVPPGARLRLRPPVRRR